MAAKKRAVPTEPAKSRETVARLAELSPLDYEAVRATTAKAMGVRAKALDDAIRAERGTDTTSGGGQPLIFPEIEPWPLRVNGAEVLDECKSICARYLDLPEHGDTVVVLWIAMTYLAENLDCMPMLFITAPEKGCGKSTVLDVVQRLSFKPLPTSSITAAALFRTVELCAPTLLIDEVDSFLRGNEAMRGILNSGHTRSAAYVIRTVGDNHEPRRFSTWGPKALAGIGRQHGTIEDRSIIVTMQRLLPNAKLEKLRYRIEFPELRQKLARWCADHGKEIAKAPIDLTKGLHNRAADNWHPLYAIAKAAGDHWPQLVSDAAEAFTRGNNIDSDGTALLRAISEAFETTKKMRLSTRQLIDLLSEDQAARWCDYDHGRPITGPQIAKLLKNYGIRPKTLRVTSKSKSVKGYDYSDFIKAFSRYISVAPAESA